MTDFQYTNFNLANQRAFLEARLMQLEAERFKVAFDLDSLTSRIEKVHEAMANLPELTDDQRKQLNTMLNQV